MKNNDEENQGREEYERRDEQACSPSHAAKYSGVGLKVDSRLRRLCLRTQIVRGVRNKIHRTLSPNQSLTQTSLASVINAIGSASSGMSSLRFRRQVRRAPTATVG